MLTRTLSKNPHTLLLALYIHLWLPLNLTFVKDPTPSIPCLLPLILVPHLLALILARTHSKISHTPPSLKKACFSTYIYPPISRQQAILLRSQPMELTSSALIRSLL